MTNTATHPDVQEIENEFIPLADGARLAARIWLPRNAATKPAPAILEFLPYRKRDGTAVRDALTQPVFAAAGYAGVRVDLRGSGESGGLLEDEYLVQEQDDALEVIAWIAAQPWCSGSVGMMGISWGGFNALQVAARRPPALKAIITICSTDDRYSDDIHYKGGALLMENFGWAATMFAYQSRPPDPLLVGDAWRDIWLHRLENMPSFAAMWAGHPHRDGYWRHGSVCEDIAAIETPVLAIGGWADAYSNAVPRLLTSLKCPVRGIIGPWVHKYPHFAVPGPRIDFIAEALRWWDRWLKEIDNDALDEPLLRMYVMDGVRPAPAYEHRDGYWAAEPNWPPVTAEFERFALSRQGLTARARDAQLTICSPQDTGTTSGEFCPIWLGPEGPTDQRVDDAGSLCFDGAPLPSATTICGAPVCTLTITSDKPVATLIARLEDVWPDGDATRITYGVLNLCHRDGHADPAPLVPGQRYTVRLQLDDIAYTAAAGNRLRLALSTSYWPLLWPAPDAARITLHTLTSHFELPIRTGDDSRARPFPQPPETMPASIDTLSEPYHQRTVIRDIAENETRVNIVDDFGQVRFSDHGLETHEIARENYAICPSEPVSCTADAHWTESIARGDWWTRTETYSTMTCDKSNFYIHIRIEAYENDEQVFENDTRQTVPRRLV